MIKLTVILASVYFLASAAIMQVVEPPKLPDGTYCSPRGVITSDQRVIDPSHPCHCEHMTHSKDCEGYVQENSKCTQYCHKESCRCPVKCEPVDLQSDGDE